MTRTTLDSIRTITPANPVEYATTRKGLDMSASTRAVRRQSAAVWSVLLTVQLVLVATTRTVRARIGSQEANPDAGFTLVEWVIMLVIIAAAAATVATLIYNWITNKAKGVTNQ